MPDSERYLLLYKAILTLAVLTYAVVSGDDTIVAVTVGTAIGYGAREGEHLAFRTRTRSDDSPDR